MSCLDLMLRPANGTGAKAHRVGEQARGNVGIVRSLPAATEAQHFGEAYEDEGVHDALRLGISGRMMVSPSSRARFTAWARLW